ncbi:hypothetical protein AAG906_003250 [Vitis piasezkii]
MRSHQSTIPRWSGPYTSTVYLSWLFKSPSLICYFVQWLDPELRAYDSTKREVMGTFEIELLIGPTTFPILFQVLRIPTSFNLLFGRTWIHRARAIPSSLHQKVKFIHDGQVQTLEMEDFCRDFVAMSFDQYGSTVVLDMMKSMSYLPGIGLGQRQHGPSEFMAIPNHDVPFMLGFIPIEADYRYMARLHKERVIGRLTHTPFDYPICPYTMSLADYFVRTLMALYFPDEVDEYGTFVEIGDIVDGVVPRDEYIDDMFAISMIVDDLFEGLVGPIKKVSDFVDPPLSFDVLSGCVLRSDDVHDSSFMDLSIFEELKIGLDLSTNERDGLTRLLRSYLDVFAWSYEDMLGLDPSIVQHHLPLLPHVKLYPEWLANVVPVPKNEGKVRVCVDFRDLNEASPKDDFSLPHIDMVVDNAVGHSMFKILMALEDIEKTSFITEWASLERFFERIRQFRLRLNPKNCTFGVTSRKLLGYMVSERGIEADPDKIRAILDMPVPRTEREIRGFLGILQYINRFIARLTDILLVVTSVLVPPTPSHHLLLYLSISNVALECMLAQLDDSCNERAIYYLSKRMLDYETRYVMIEPALVGRLMRCIIVDHLASLPVFDGRAIDDDFPDEDVVVVTSLSGWRMYFDGAANHSGYEIETTLELGIRHMEVFGDSNLVLRQIQGKWKTRDVKLRPYHAYLELLVGRFDDLRYTYMPRA